MYGGDVMADGTPIEWTDAMPLQAEGKLSSRFPASAPDLAGMLFVVTVPTQGDTVGNVESQIVVICKRLDVVGLQVSPTIVTAVLARESVSAEYIKAPSRVFRSMTQPVTLRGLAVLEGKMSLSPYAEDSKRAADLYARIYVVTLPQSLGIWLAFSRCRHRSDCLRSMLAALEWRRSTDCALFLFHAAAQKARSIDAIVTRSVAPELRYRLPCFASGAPALSSRESGHVGGKVHASFFGRNLQRSVFGLSHDNVYTGKV
jgi:hypothetical protein